MVKKVISISLFVILLVSMVLTGCVQQQPASEEKSHTDIAQETVLLMASGQFEEAYQNFDATVQSQITVQQLEEEIWDAIIMTYGDFVGIVSTRETNESGYHIIYVTMEFSDLGYLDLRFAFADEPLIAGLRIDPTDQSDQYRPPQYADTSLFTETNVTVGTEQWTLPGTLSMPVGEGPFPAVVLVHGSGPNDRDETIGPNKPFKDLAWGLASNGIAVLRYEKRTKQYPQEIIAILANFTVQEETVEDAIAAVQLLNHTSGINTSMIFVLGHSLGGMLAPDIAKQEAEIDGVLMLAAPTRSLAELYIEQITYLADVDGERTTEEQTLINETQQEVDKILAGNLTDTDIVLGASKAYWTDLEQYNTTATAETLTIPMFIAQGANDYQVRNETDFAEWTMLFQDDEQVTLRSYQGLNHLFMEAGEPPSNEEYLIPSNVDEQVIIDIVQWIEQQK